jgi:hypothetical protein
VVKSRKRGRWDNLNKRKNLKLRQDYMDTFFINGVTSVTGEGKGIRALTEEEKDWLNNFYGEYYNASVNHRSYEEQLHDNEELVKDCYDRNNSRNRCLLNKGKAINKVEFRSWKDFDQDTIHDDFIYENEQSIRLDDYDHKKKMYNRINKIYPDLFEFNEFMSYDIELIFEKIKSIE